MLTVYLEINFVIDPTIKSINFGSSFNDIPIKTPFMLFKFNHTKCTRMCNMNYFDVKYLMSYIRVSWNI